jgi:hypothetical protein
MLAVSKARPLYCVGVNGVVVPFVNGIGLCSTMSSRLGLQSLSVLFLIFLFQLVNGFNNGYKKQKGSLLLLLVIADHVKYITYSETKLDCNMPLVLLNSCIFGNKLMTVATKHRIMLNVRKNICNPHSVFYMENK